MKRTIIGAAALLAAIALAPVPLQAAEPYIESDATLYEGVSRASAIAAAQYVQAWGYRCDSISSVIPFAFSPGLYIKCNRYRYSYEIEDKGGNWIVTLD